MNVEVIHDLNMFLDHLKQAPAETVLVYFKHRLIDAIELVILSDTDIRLHGLDIETGEFVTVTTPEDASVTDLITAVDWSIDWVLEAYEIGITEKDIFTCIKKPSNMATCP